MANTSASNSAVPGTAGHRRDAAQHPNRRVAEELFLSPKTVQFHLTRIFAKLGVETRGELAARHGAELAE